MDIKKVVEAKSVEDLEKLEKEMLDEMKKEQKDEDEIIHAIQDIVSSLMVFEKASAVINGTRYMVKVKIAEMNGHVMDSKGNAVVHRQVVLMASDIVKAEIMSGRYFPAIARVDYNYDLTHKGNITAAVEGWVRHITGTVKPEMLEE